MGRLQTTLGSFGVIVLAASSMAALSPSAVSASAKPARSEVIAASAFARSPAIATLGAPVSPASPPSTGPAEPGGFIPDRGHQRDGALQQDVGVAAMPAAVSFEGLSGTTKPPDPNGAVGPNHYVEMVNMSVGIFTKAGAQLVNAQIGSIFTALPGIHACEGNHGDPVVVHDQLADRWLLTQFTTGSAPYFLCVAVSQTADPAGAYFLYAFSTGSNFPDYPKFGLWSGAYLASTRELNGSGGPFVGVGAYAFDRSKMLLGNPTAVALKVLLTTSGGAWRPGDGLIPADLDGTINPPNPNLAYFIGTMDGGAGTSAPFDGVNVFRLGYDFTTNVATLSLAASLSVAAFDSIFPCSPTGRDCIPQQSTSQKIDVLSYRQRPLHRAAYRVVGGYESLVTNQSVEATAGRAGVRWYEIRGLSGTPAIAQQGTFAPADSLHRWMGSIAQDRARDMALGYSVSASTLYPSIRYTGRLASDPLSTLPQGEAVMVAGTGSQTGSNRWGDYTSMTVDPVDDCTFWYVNQYYATSGGTWKTRIGHFQYPSCQLSAYVSGPGTIMVKSTYTFTAVTTGAVSPTYTWTERFCEDAFGTICSPPSTITGLGSTFNRVLGPDCTGTGEKNYRLKVEVQDYDSTVMSSENRVFLCLQ